MVPSLGLPLQNPSGMAQGLKTKISSSPHKNCTPPNLVEPKVSSPPHKKCTPPNLVELKVDLYEETPQPNQLQLGAAGTGIILSMMTSPMRAETGGNALEAKLPLSRLESTAAITM